MPPFFLLPPSFPSPPPLPPIPTEVDGLPTPDLDAFLGVVTHLADGADVRLRLVHCESNKAKVITMKTDYRYWATFELRLDAPTAEWRRVAHDSDAVAFSSAH